MLVYDPIHDEITEEICKEEVTVVRTKFQKMRDAFIEHILDRGVKMVVDPNCEKKRLIYEPKYAYGVKQPVTHMRPILIGTVQVKAKKGLPAYSGKSFVTDAVCPETHLRSQAIKKVR